VVSKIVQKYPIMPRHSDTVRFLWMQGVTAGFWLLTFMNVPNRVFVVIRDVYFTNRPCGAIILTIGKSDGPFLVTF
jgi:hypothetical protein